MAWIQGPLSSGMKDCLFKKKIAGRWPDISSSSRSSSKSRHSAVAGSSRQQAAGSRHIHAQVHVHIFMHMFIHTCTQTC